MTTRSIAAVLSLVFCLGLLVSPVATTADDYVAVAITKKGDFPVPENVDNIDDKHLIQVRWGDYVGPTRRVGVLPVDNTSTSGSYAMSIPGMGEFTMPAMEYGGGQVPVNGIESMITDCMSRTGRFRLVERVAMEDVLAEQNLNLDQRTTEESGAKVGQILGAEYLIQAVVTSYEPNFQGKKGGLGGAGSGLAAGFGSKKTQSLVGMNFRLIDTETSEIIFTKQIDAIMTSKEWNFDAAFFGGGSGFGGFMSSYANTPIGQAVMSAVNQGVLELVKEIGVEPTEGNVVRVDGDRVYVNLGSDVVEPGEIFTAIKPGEELIDPATGMSLGGEKTILGKLKLVSVQEKFSVGEPVDFTSSMLTRGDPIISTREPPPLVFASSWAGPKGKKQK